MLNDPVVETLGAVVIRPTGGEITCHQGKGSLIDYALCSRVLAPYVRIEIVSKVPWEPHDGLRVKVVREAKAFMVTRLRRPLAMSELEKRQPRGKPKEVSWDTAVSMAEAAVGSIRIKGHKALGDQERLMREGGGLEESSSLGRELLVWARMSCMTWRAMAMT